VEQVEEEDEEQSAELEPRFLQEDPKTILGAKL